MSDPSAPPTPTPTPTPGPRPRRKRRWKTLALILSVALNLFIIAFILGQATRGYLDDGRRPFDRGALRVDWTHMVESLPPEARDQARAILREGSDQMRDMIRNLQRARETAAQAALADPYDEEAARAAFAEVRRRTAEVQQLIQEGLLRLAADLTPQERRRMFESLPPPARP